MKRGTTLRLMVQISQVLDSMFDSGTATDKYKKYIFEGQAMELKCFKV